MLVLVVIISFICQRLPVMDRSPQGGQVLNENTIGKISKW